MSFASGNCSTASSPMWTRHPRQPPPSHHHDGWFSLHRSPHPQTPSTTATDRHDQVRYEFPLAHRGHANTSSSNRHGDWVHHIASFLFYTCVHAGGLYVGWHYIRPLVLYKWQRLTNRTRGTATKTCCCCSATMAYDDKYCNCCGSRVTESTTCPLCSYCGASILDDRAPFCPACGKPVPTQVVVDPQQDAGHHDAAAATAIGYVRSDMDPTPLTSNRSVTTIPVHEQTHFPVTPKEDTSESSVPMAESIPLVPVDGLAVEEEHLPLVQAVYVEEVDEHHRNTTPRTPTMNGADNTPNATEQSDNGTSGSNTQHPPPTAPPG